MKMRVVAWIVWTGVAVILCLASFWYGRSSDPYERYDEVALLEDRAILLTLRAGDTTNAIRRLEGFLDLGTYNAMLVRSSVHGQYRQSLDSTFVKIAHYRDEYPRLVDTTNGFGAIQTKVDVFLHSIDKTQPNTSLEPTPTAPSAFAALRRDT